MKIFFIIISIAIYLPTMYGAVKGLDLRTKRGWRFVFFGFLAGLLFGLSYENSLINSAFLGVLTGLITAYTGLSHLRINRWVSKSKYYKKYSNDK
jgi:hypothetical protein